MADNIFWIKSDLNSAIRNLKKLKESNYEKNPHINGHITDVLFDITSALQWISYEVDSSHEKALKETIESCERYTQEIMSKQ